MLTSPSKNIAGSQTARSIMCPPCFPSVLPRRGCNRHASERAVAARAAPSAGHSVRTEGAARCACTANIMCKLCYALYMHCCTMNCGLQVATGDVGRRSVPSGPRSRPLVHWRYSTCAVNDADSEHPTCAAASVEGRRARDKPALPAKAALHLAVPGYPLRFALSALWVARAA